MAIEQLYTVREVSKMLKISTNTLRQWLHRGKLKGVLVGDKARRIPESEIKKLLDDSNK